MESYLFKIVVVEKKLKTEDQGTFLMVNMLACFSFIGRKGQ